METTSKPTIPSPPLYYTPLPTEIPLTSIGIPSLQRYSRLRMVCAAALLLVTGLGYAAWPSGPDVEIVRLNIKHIKVRTKPRPMIDISMVVKVKVSNAGVYTMDYETLDVEVGYRGKTLGHVRSDHGHVRALGWSYVDAELEFDGVEVMHDVVRVLEDLAKGTIPLDTVTAVDGQLGLLFFRLPLKAKISCEILVSVNDESIESQNCYTL